MSELAIYIFTKRGCPYCSRAKELLEKEGLQYQEISISDQPERRGEMIAKANGRTTVPQIFINEVHVGGCDDLYVLYEKNGKLT